MGNVSSVGVEGEGWNKKQNIVHGKEGKQDPLDLMGQSPPWIPRMAAESPPHCIPQISTFQVTLSAVRYSQTPVAPLPKYDELDSEMQACYPCEYTNAFFDEGIPTMITWSHGGNKVSVQGSWDKWKTMKSLQRSGSDFSILIVLPSGFYQFRFIVDGELRYARDFPWTHDEIGNGYNILNLQGYVPDQIESIADFEPPLSPESSYNSCPLSSEDYAKEPPVEPSHLSAAPLKMHSILDNPSSFPRPHHVVLNHLYIQNRKNGQPVLALGETNRFLAKYVTVVLFKSVQK